MEGQFGLRISAKGTSQERNNKCWQELMTLMIALIIVTSFFLHHSPCKTTSLFLLSSLLFSLFSFLSLHLFPRIPRPPPPSLSPLPHTHTLQHIPINAPPSLISQPPPLSLPHSYLNKQTNPITSPSLFLASFTPSPL